MLTFNSIAFVSSPDFWAAYQAWVEERARHHEATYWSCTLEISTHSQDAGRIHLHGYWSWHGQSRGVDQRNTDAWVFKGVRPRVDVNSDRRGPSEWLRATQHGHFYVQVFKIGTVYSATNPNESPSHNRACMSLATTSTCIQTHSSCKSTHCRHTGMVCIFMT